MKITLKTHVTISGRFLRPGDVVEDLPTGLASSLVAHGYASAEGSAPAKVEAVRTADAPPAVETAVAGPSAAKKARAK